MNRIKSSILLLVIGTGIVSFALLANHFGFDLDNSWGIGRKLVLGFGLGLFCIGILIITWDFWLKVGASISTASQTSISWLLNIPIVNRIFTESLSWWKRLGSNSFIKWIDERVNQLFQNTRFFRYLSKSNSNKANLAAAVTGCFVITVYIWLVSVGLWTNWPRTNDYYNQLTDAFLHGQVSLLAKPDPALITLQDPYNFQNRTHIPQLWDMSLYKGKYYLYWGPTPALVLLPIKVFFKGVIGDQILVFSFLSGAFIFATLIILRLYEQLFSNLHWGYVLPGVTLAGFANPLPWILNRPGIYEAAIAGGQFFLIAGVFFSFKAIEKERTKLVYLIITSICWGLAIGSRISLIIAILYLLLILALVLVYTTKEKRGKWEYLFAISIPFMLGLLGLGIYNKVRFESWFEFGHRYQLTGQNLYAFYSQVFSTANIPPNIFNYLINPFRALNVFPFIKPEWGGKYIFFYIKTPLNYYTEQVSGLIPTVPFVIFAFIPIVFLIGKLLNSQLLARTKSFHFHIGKDEVLVSWLAISISGAFLLALTTILFYLVATMRYLADTIILGILTSTLGTFIGLSYLADRPKIKKLFGILVVTLAIYSIAIGLLLAITGYEARFEKLNPALFEYLTRLLTP